MSVSTAVISLVFSICFSLYDLNLNSIGDSLFLTTILSTSGILFFVEKMAHFQFFFYNGTSICILIYYAAINIFLYCKDMLTSAFNRNFFESFINTKEQKDAIIFMFDLNDLKLINDQNGHLVGDEKIKELSNTLIESFGKLGRIFRYGGDEFIVIINKIKNESKINNALEKFELITKEKSINVAYGKALFFAKDGNIKDLIEVADNNMYEYKRKMKENLN